MSHAILPVAELSRLERIRRRFGSLSRYYDHLASRSLDRAFRADLAATPGDGPTRLDRAYNDGWDAGASGDVFRNPPPGLSVDERHHWVAGQTDGYEDALRRLPDDEPIERRDELQLGGWGAHEADVSWAEELWEGRV